MRLRIPRLGAACLQQSLRSGFREELPAEADARQVHKGLQTWHCKVVLSRRYFLLTASIPPPELGRGKSTIHLCRKLKP
ncbi:hypothetical protein JYU34_017541 [Plutella xylostella]|uniref:Uncharacterized protein n=1 Tax=Plutella xylostella TaxID=51655 RepID=A0ABQ7Q1F6_PLUXY|nr:hypothetical protein JYU34_017541 [Plutella xylostella]